MTDNLKYVHSIVHEILGISVPESGEATLLDGHESSVWACVTGDPTDYRRDIDESAAVANMLLRGLVGGGPDASLDIEGADGDVEDFVAAKRSRDALAHGQEVQDSELPVQTVHRILGKYLLLHATSRVASESLSATSR